MKAIDFAINRVLPEDLRQPSYDLSKKGVGKLLAQVATKYPDKYPEISKRLGDLGRNYAWSSGYSTGPEDTKPVIDTPKYLAKLDAELDSLRKEKLDKDEFEERRSEIYLKYSQMLEKDTMTEAIKRRNRFALAAQSGARGNAAHIQAILSSPGVFTDTHDKIIPLFVRSSYGQGVRPAETLAGTWGARKAVVATKTATARGGDLLKIMMQNGANYNVTERDCGVDNGIALTTDDESLTGRVLVKPAAGFEAGTVIDRRVAGQLRRKQGDKQVIARSTMTCQAENGICAKCAGLNAEGRFPAIGESYGITQAQAVGEPIVQGSLNTKHGGGQAKGSKSFSGLDYITQFVQIPESFNDRAAVAEKAGVVSRVEEAPQGGSYIYVDDEQHFVLPGFELKVKPGDTVEAGDQLSEGLVNPADIVRLRGLGSGRAYYATRLKQMLQDSGQNPDSRAVEMLARANVDNVRVSDPDEEDPWNPDELVRSSKFLKSYRPPEDTRNFAVDNAVGKYLQRPVLHYTVGTKITPRMANKIKTAGFKEIPLSNQEPNFEPELRRLRVASHDSRDWMASMGTSYLGGQLQESLERADETDVINNYHFGPRLAYGVDFGKDVETTGKF